ncbi:MAG: MBL fold metallo-hydrolase [Candidatus Bathyarchaeota archaeon]|nr:MAG: MBL fold metallo-hydrolase [Candidatus Bathyarchaeota archaeon]
MSKQQNKLGLIREFLSQPLEKDEIAFLYLGYAGVVLRLEDEVAAFDIANLLGNSEIAALSRLCLLAYTHSHTDHYNRARARRILKETNAHIVAQKQVAEDLKGEAHLERLTVAEHRKSIRVGGFEVVAIDGVHPRPISIYRIKKGRFNVFHGGDSGYCPVKDYPAKLVFLPTGLPSPSCSPESALKFTLDLKPRVAVAMHGKLAQMNKFKTLVKKEQPDTTIIIPEKNKPETILI